MRYALSTWETLLKLTGSATKDSQLKIGWTKTGSVSKAIIIGSRNSDSRSITRWKKKRLFHLWWKSESLFSRNSIQPGSRHGRHTKRHWSRLYTGCYHPNWCNEYRTLKPNFRISSEKDPEGYPMLEDTAGIRRVVLACGNSWPQERNWWAGYDHRGSVWTESIWKGTLFLFCGKWSDRCKGLLWRELSVVFCYPHKSSMKL